MTLLAYLEYVKTLVVDHLPVVPQKLHDGLQMFARVDILRHNTVVGAIE